MFDLLRFRRWTMLYGNPVGVTAGRHHFPRVATARPAPEDQPAPESQEITNSGFDFFTNIQTTNCHV